MRALWGIALLGLCATSACRSTGSEASSPYESAPSAARETARAEKLTREALAESPLDTRAKDRCKNMVALGVLYWLYNRDPAPSVAEAKPVASRAPAGA